MRHSALGPVLLGLAFTVASAAAVTAQPGNTPAPSPAPATSAPRSGDAPTPPPEASDVVAASPRTTTDTRALVFGMEPFTAVLVGVGVLLAVAIAIGITTRPPSGQRIDRDRLP